MTRACTQAEGPLCRLASALASHLRTPVEVQWTKDGQGDPRAWLEFPDRERPYVVHRIASLTIREHGSAASYTIATVGSAPQRFAGLATALRKLQAAAVVAWENRGAEIVEQDASDALGQLPERTEGESAKRRQSEIPPKRMRFTADQAASHPVIRAAVVVGHELRKTTAAVPDAAALLVLVNEALGLADRLVPRGKPEVATDAWIERTLVGIVLGGLTASDDEGLAPRS